MTYGNRQKATRLNTFNVKCKTGLFKCLQFKILQAVHEKKNWKLNAQSWLPQNIFNIPVMSNHTNRAVTGHNSLFKGLAQRESVTPEKK